MVNEEGEMNPEEEMKMLEEMGILSEKEEFGVKMEKNGEKWRRIEGWLKELVMGVLERKSSVREKKVEG